MKGIIWYINIGVTVILVTGSILIVNHMKEQDNRELALQKKQLEEKHEKLKSEYEYISQQNVEEDISFKYWSEMEVQAENLHEDSGGAFKRSWAIYLVKKANEYKVDPVIVYELLKVETGRTFDPSLVGPKTKYGKAYGMAQFMTNTAPWIADMADLPYKKDYLFDPYYAMHLSIVYLDYLHNKYNNWNEALTAYHRGMGGLKQYKEENGDADSWYAEEIQSNAAAHETLASAN
ncbi:lytic transglycosylase domain-containing protein [Halobacillus sp. Marseille-Q1614]|uniref:lytic transglycosylase domain-containing protein n=1 Tax=Halobacillus sp. Marseille-Q1614 TaxID=2709134 RepID=UPI00156E97C9|nr:transglycosylase SLT domain-containing protein [Halobacillus sp. Marseille-Q1614]